MDKGKIAEIVGVVLTGAGVGVGVWYVFIRKTNGITLFKKLTSKGTQQQPDTTPAKKSSGGGGGGNTYTPPGQSSTPSKVPGIYASFATSIYDGNFKVVRQAAKDQWLSTTNQGDNGAYWKLDDGNQIPKSASYIVGN